MGAEQAMISAQSAAIEALAKWRMSCGQDNCGRNGEPCDECVAWAETYYADKLAALTAAAPKSETFRVFENSDGTEERPLSHDGRIDWATGQLHALIARLTAPEEGRKE